MLPNFLIIGTAKSGTTTLWRQVCKHPQAGFASGPEPNFFAFDKRYRKGLSYYESYFAHCAGKVAVGEKSWRYSIEALYPRARDRIAEHLPNARLVYVVRHPLARAESLWIECLSAGTDSVSPDFNDSVRENPLFVDSTRYWRQLNRYRQYFSDDDILVLLYEDLALSQRSVLGTLFSFLGMDCAPAAAFDEIRENISEGKCGDSAVLAAARRVPGFGSIRDVTPPIARSRLRRALKRKLDRPVWEPDTRQWFLDQVGEDCARILSYAKKSPGYWTYDQV